GADEPRAYRLNYILGSPMYGTSPLPEVLAEVHRVGATAIDIWPRSHANHREQLDELGHEKVAELLAEYQVELGVITRYDLGPFGLGPELPVAQRLGAKLIVTGAKPAPGETLKQQVSAFVKQLKPHVERAALHGVTIGIENHAGSLLHSPDSIRYFSDAIDYPNLGLAMAPYHLPQDPRVIADLIQALGKERLVFFQAWEHGKGCMNKLPKEEEMLQMPARGPLDFAPILSALRAIDYAGWTEIFMHPVPRGIPVRPTTAEVTEEINHSRAYLDQCLDG
ncbi:MAG: sugar phosphate isomerase/epimerase, partial [Planctomycetales bacterium]|nr:sugar phosphate isomerase/epimerase [Planctomycetales bacterium]